MYSKDQLLCTNILEAADNIIDFTKDFNNVDEFINNRLHYDATLMNFIVIGEMTVKISDEFKEEHPETEWYKMYGFRNILAHDYCLLYTSDAADDLLCVDLGGRR